MGFVIKIDRTLLLSAHNRWKKKSYESFTPFYAERRQMNKLCVKCEPIGVASKVNQKFEGGAKKN